MPGSLQDVKACVSDLKKPAKTSENFHWAIGADLRRDWATRKIKDVESAKEGRDDSDGFEKDGFLGPPPRQNIGAIA